MSAEVNYGSLLAEIEPQIAHEDELYRNFLDRLSSFVVRESLNEAEEKIVELLTVIIRQYEQSRFEKIEKAHGIEVLLYLMEHQGLKNKDLVPSVFETESVASDILKGKRGLTVRHVRRLAERFSLSTDVFIEV